MFEPDSPASEAACAPLLASDEPPAVEVIHREGRACALIVCDHATRRVPRALGDLGIDAAAHERHIAWDIGAAAVSRLLSRSLDACLAMAGYSRLVLDPNRALDDPTSIPLISDGVVVPANRDLAPQARAARAAALFHPYHRAVAAEIARLRAGGRAPAVISMHSFTPVFKDEDRPWHCGVLWNRDPRMAVPVIAALAARGDVPIGDNQPYSGRDGYGYTVEAHAGAAGLPHITFEIRQDRVADAAGVAEWAARIGAALAPVLADATLYRVERY